MPTLESMADLYVPLAASFVSLIAVSVAFLALHYSRRDRHESLRALELDAVRREQDALSMALQGAKEAMGLLALQLVRQPDLITASTPTGVVCALCLAFVFESSNRARALVLKALQTFSGTKEGHRAILEILHEMETDFTAYAADMGEEELTKYIARIVRPLQVFCHYCGMEETREHNASDFLEGNQALSRLLLDRGVRQSGVSDLRSPHGRHSWDCWNPQLAEFLRVLSTHWKG
jgi:hypothetical protein